MTSVTVGKVNSFNTLFTGSCLLNSLPSAVIYIHIYIIHKYTYNVLFDGISLAELYVADEAHAGSLAPAPAVSRLSSYNDRRSYTFIIIALS